MLTALFLVVVVPNLASDFHRCPLTEASHRRHLTRPALHPFLDLQCGCSASTVLQPPSSTSAGMDSCQPFALVLLSAMLKILLALVFSSGTGFWQIPLLSAITFLEWPMAFPFIISIFVLPVLRRIDANV